MVSLVLFRMTAAGFLSVQSMVRVRRRAAYTGGHHHPGAAVAAGEVYIASGMPVVRAWHPKEMALVVYRERKCRPCT
jgi:hypothetical protein